MARVHVLKEVRSRHPGSWQLCFQWCRFEQDDGTHYGYRFIWRTENESVHAARGQARIPTVAEGKFLMDQALAAGWGERDGDAMKAAAIELEKRGYAVTFGAGYVGTPHRQTAIQARPTSEELEWMRIIHEWA